MASCILYQNKDSSVIVIDIPHSIEAAQGFAPEFQPRLISLPPSEVPYPSLEPKSAKAKARLPPVPLDDLFIQKHIQLALAGVRQSYHGEWCLERAVIPAAEATLINERKRKRNEKGSERHRHNCSLGEAPQDEDVQQRLISKCSLFSNNATAVVELDSASSPTLKPIWLPPKTTFLLGDITQSLDTFRDQAPVFDLVVLDPPWPNRSARRKKSYDLSYGNTEIHELLTSIPLHYQLADRGTVAIWITNKQIFRDLVLGEGGLFEKWGVTLVEEWIWLKVTKSGEPICALDGLWRKPYEILLIGKRGAPKSDLKRRVLIGVPDLHSRKPNLKIIFEPLVEKKEYNAIEVFARNLTAGWWSWGNEILKFQDKDCWIDSTLDIE